MFGEQYLVEWLGKTFKVKVADDRCDRLNYATTATMLILFAIMNACKQYVGSSIQCVMPMEFTSSMERFAENLCNVKNTYFITDGSAIPGVIDRKNVEIGFYQWVPFMLLIQAIMFKSPSWIWSSLFKHAGLDFPSVINEAKALRSGDSESRKQGIVNLAGSIENMLETRSKNEYTHTYWKISSLLYISIKIWYLINVLFQFWLLDAFIGNENWFWGVRAMFDFIAGRQWKDSGLFPRVTLCDFEVPIHGNMQNFTVQCVLTNNIIYEKMFLFIWLWFIVVLANNLVNTSFTIGRLSINYFRRNFIRSLLGSKYQDNSLILQIENFAIQKLKQDGVLLMSFIDDHVGSILTMELCEKLFEDFQKKVPNTRDEASQTGEEEKLTIETEE